MVVEFLVGGAAILHLFIAPFTKVEESFNMQACHDLLYHGPFLSQYDHYEYPGVVPRSFLGPALLSFMAFPFVTIFKFIGISKLYSQYVVRISLALLSVVAWRKFYSQIKKSFGLGVSLWLTFITITQFHFIYYISRTLPNTFALLFALLSYSYWLEQDHWKFVVSSGIGLVVFRMELGIILAPMLIHDLVITKRIGFLRLLWWVFIAGTMILGLTVAVDSLFWGRIVWPEGEVFWFNVILNQSHLWGTLPVLWYWYSALPRALGASYLLVPLGLYADTRMRLLVAPALFFIIVFSLLPHKELRFILPALPLVNVAAAAGCQFLWRNRTKSALWSMAACGAALHLLCNATLTTLLLTVSAANYPGGEALLRLHQLVPADYRLSVHIDNLAAQTGVTRFLEINPGWVYNKTENLKAGSPELRRFSHLLVEAKTKYAYNLKHYSDTHNILESIDSFARLSFNYQQFPPVKIIKKPSLFVLENLIDEDIEWNPDPEWLEELKEELEHQEEGSASVTQEEEQQLRKTKESKRQKQKKKKKKEKTVLQPEADAEKSVSDDKEKNDAEKDIINTAATTADENKNKVTIENDQTQEQNSKTTESVVSSVSVN